MIHSQTTALQRSKKLGAHPWPGNRNSCHRTTAAGSEQQRLLPGEELPRSTGHRKAYWTSRAQEWNRWRRSRRWQPFDRASPGLGVGGQREAAHVGQRRPGEQLGCEPRGFVGQALLLDEERPWEQEQDGTGIDAAEHIA